MTDESKKEIIYKSKLPEIQISDHLPLHHYCFQRISDHPSRPCLINGPNGRISTYADVHITARRVAAGFHSRLGVHKGDVIMLCLHNCPEFIFCFLGASMLGAVSTTVNPLCTAPEIGKQARAAGAKVIVTLAAFAEKVKGLAATVVVVDEPVAEGCLAFGELAAADEAEIPVGVEIGPDDVVALPYSSGTTGLPKGVMLTHKNMVTSVAQQVDGENPHIHLTSDDVILCLPPLFHIYSLIAVFLCSLRVGAAIVLMPKFNINTMMDLIQKHRVTVAPFVPPIALALSRCPDVDDYDLSSIQKVVCGAAPMAKELEDTLRAKLANAVLGQGYGMTESALLAMSLGFAKEPGVVKSGACGSVVRNAEMKIVDPLTGVSLPRNQAGEICIRGNQVMKGYLNDPEATAHTFDKEGWLQTGDIGYVDDDDDLFIVDRLKELIKYKGFQVAPAELEGLLLNHPCISDAAVIGMKDEVAGEVPIAFIVTSNGNQITEDEIKQYVSEKVVYYKRIRQVIFVESIPKLPSGKILRKELRAMIKIVA